MKKIIACVLFCAIVIASLAGLTDFLTYKGSNRYYLMEKYLQEHPEHNNYDVKVFGACHAYTSLYPGHLEETTGISTFLYANPGEIMPVTYLHMVEQFKKHTRNLERLPFSLEKQEVIKDFVAEDAGSVHFPLANYKDRLTDGSLAQVDFQYSFRGFELLTHPNMVNEMRSRLTRNGFKLNPSVAVLDYPQQKAVIGEDDFAEIHPLILKYLQKIVDLCREEGVELIFYRSPYTANEGELGRVKHMKQFCQENGVLFLDLEEEVAFSYVTDFYDYQHLSETGAKKATDFLAPYITEALK